MLLRHAFDELGCIRVEFKTDSRNISSRNAIERIGAVEEGTLRNHMIMPDGVYRHSTYFSRNIARYEEQGVGLWAACLKESGEVVGDCGLIYQTIQEQQEVEVAYHLRADQRGKGLATEAALACLDHGFNVLDCDRIVSMAHPDNHASKRVAQRVHQDWRRFTRDAARYYLFHTTREAHA